MNRFDANRAFLTDLFAGPFPGHGIISMADGAPRPPGPDDAITSDLPLSAWIDHAVRSYEHQAAWSAAIGDDAVPYARAWTGTELFAAAMGCRWHVFADSPPCALPRVNTPEEADALPEPSLDHPVFDRFFAFADGIAQRLGPNVPVGIGDIQSPFDVAALVWRKEDMMVALYDRPEAVVRLVDKCGRLITAFIAAFMQRRPEANLCHCPYAWAPPALGCWLSEDEAGSLSVEAFEEFCLPWLSRLSTQFGGLFMHCCATADHQYDTFAQIPNLRGLNRVFQAPGPVPAIRRFAGRSVLMQAFEDGPRYHGMLDAALPSSRFLFNLPPQPMDEARRTFEALRRRCPRVRTATA